MRYVLRGLDRLLMAAAFVCAGVALVAIGAIYAVLWFFFTLFKETAITLRSFQRGG